MSGRKHGSISVLGGAMVLCGACVFDMGPLPESDHATGAEADAVTQGSSTGGAPLEDPATAGEGSDESGGEPNDCCELGTTPGCLDATVEACVCAVDAHCCASAWDELCVHKVDVLGCGECRAGGAEPAACCTAQRTPGCEDAATEACVCASNAYCCHVAWDDKCVGLVDALGCGRCDADPGARDCCKPHGATACVDQDTAACVCELDPYCCDQAWDEICVAQVEAFGCGVCDSQGLDDGDCCSAQVGPGCEDPETRRCVCELDAFCCQVQWDEVCVEGVVEVCGGCPAGEGDRDGETTGNEPEPHGATR